MQAHPLSISAAGNHHDPSGPSFTHTAFPFQPVTVKTRPFSTEQMSISEGSGLAHDAGNLLSALGLYSELLARPGVLLPEHAHYAVELRDIAQRSGRLMQRLIPHIPAQCPLPSPRTPQARQAPASSHPAVVVRNLEPLLRAIAAPHATISIKVPRSVPEADFAAEDLERILINLVRNAAQAIERSCLQAPGQSGHIGVALCSEGDHLNLSVEDDGPGMPVLAAAAFLAPSPLASGTDRGLGHRIIHELVTNTGGTLSVRVRPGRGTSFLIQWPVDYRVTSSAAAPASFSDTGFHEVSAC